MEIKNKGRQLGLATTLIGGAMLAFSINSTAAEMDHSQHQGMDHSQHAGMDHSKAAQASQHVHHAHGVGQWMFEYRYMSMDMEDLIEGSSSVSSNDISGVTAMTGMCMNSPMGIKDPTKDYCMAPTDMTMNMHMFMAMYGFSEKLSGMLMLNYLDNEMGMIMHVDTGMMQMDMKSDMDTSGLGDIQAGVMYRVDDKLTAGIMLSVPTGDIDEEVYMAMMDGVMGMDGYVQAPYGMQLGTGTYDLIPSISYVDKTGKWTYGGQAEYRYHIGENDNDYTWGNKLKVSGYGKYALNSTVGLGARLEYLNADEIDGEDKNVMTTAMSPTYDPVNYGGTRIDLGVDITAQTGGHTFGLGYAVPVDQDVNGIQLETQSILTLSYMYMM